MGILKFFKEWKDLNKKLTRSFNKIYQRVVILEKEKITKQDIEELINKRINELREQTPRTPRTKIRRKAERLVNRVELIAEIKEMIKNGFATTEIYNVIVEQKKMCEKTCFYKHLKGVRKLIARTPRTKIAN